MTGKISAIKRFAVHDGDGIRTTVFFKGCPLDCIWCHNPESISFSSQIALYSHKCVGCGECLSCKYGAVSIDDGKAYIDEGKCVVCGECVDMCVFFARELFGKQVAVEELVRELVKDRPFYESSGGGVTLSGGECLSQPDFAEDLLKALKREGISVAIDTCGYVPRDILDRIIPLADTFLFDIKAIDPEVHKGCTGRDNSLILSNFEYLCQRGCDIEVRIPFVVGCNDGEIERIGEFLRAKPVRKVTVLQYHDMARSKYSAVRKSDTMPHNLTDKTAVDKAVRALKNYGLPAVSGRDD